MMSSWLWIGMMFGTGTLQANPLLVSQYGIEGSSIPDGYDVRWIFPSYAKEMAGYWRFDGNYRDSSGKSQHGTARGSTTLTTGIFGQAASFNGTSDYVDFASTVLTAATNITVSAWVKTSNTTSSMGIFGSGVKTGCNPSTQYFDLTGGKVYHNIGCGSSVISSGSYVASSWNHVLFTRDAGNLVRLYLNGSLVGGPTNNSGGNAPSIGNEMIGASWIGGVMSHYFNGQMDEVAIWNRVLTEVEVSILYQIQSAPELVSQGKTSSQSSPYSLSYPASNANDGVMTSFSHTAWQDNPWWQVDLEVRRHIKQVNIWGRYDASAGWDCSVSPPHVGCWRLSQLDFLVSDDNSSWRQVAYMPGYAVYPSTIEVNAWGRYLRVRSRQTNQVLDPAEIQVYASPEVPPSIANLALWFDATMGSTLHQDSAKTTLVSASGNPVGAWTDRVASLGAFQSTAAKRPTYITDGSGGLGIVRFDGSSSLLQSTSTISLTTPSTIFAVVRNTTTTDGVGGVFSHAGTSIPGVGLYAAARNQYVVDGAGAYDLNSANTSKSLYPLWVVTLTYPGSSTNGTSIYLNGILEETFATTGGASIYPGSALIQIGGRTWGNIPARLFGGDIGEIIVYNALLSASQRARVEAYLMAKWQL